jgi:hypothetical protein
MTATELLNYYWRTWVEHAEDGGGNTFKEWVEADGEFQAKHLDKGEEMKFSEMYHRIVD